MSDFKSIKNWTEDEQPREKMASKGAEALSDAELLAILLGTGTVKRSAVDLARDILGLAQNNLIQLGRLDIKELQRINGIGEAKAITVKAAMELGRRRQVGEVLERPTISKSDDAAKILVPLMQDLNHEVFYVIYLNHSRKVLKIEMISSGGFTGTVADIKMILKNCLLNNANQLVIGHNHPSGTKKPSEADKSITIRLRDSANMMDIKLLDHIIVAGNDFLSMSDEGII